ncbi:MAG: hypothetical protein LBV69_09070 [Bacteroidales bacterium]|jgi:hypothetical protein|nr:hypothetical protein [Bacteroidales bacterium]
MKKIIIILSIIICNNAIYAQKKTTCKEIKYPCLGEYYDTEEYWTGEGVSHPTQFLDSAIIHATHSAIAVIGMKMVTSIKAVVKDYSDIMDTAAINSYHYELISEKVTEVDIEDVQVVCQQITREKKGNYIVYVVARVHKKKVGKFDTEKFKELLEEKLDEK